MIGSERGIALAIAVFALAVIGALVGGIFFLGRLEQQSGRNAIFTVQAGEVAEAGLSDAVATVAAATLEGLPVGGAPVDIGTLTQDLWRRGVRRLMVEGGGQIHTQFLTAGLADELHLVVAPFFVGDPRARRFVGAGAFPWHPGHRAHLAETRQMGDVVLLRYAFAAAEAS